MSSRTIYASSNGDVWHLRRTGDGLVVVHEPNQASGGHERAMPLGAFLAREGETPQGKALLDLVGSLLHKDREPNEADDPTP